MPTVSEETIAPQALLDVVRCGCKAEGKLCETDSCSCRKGAISCTGFCSCCGTEQCKNPYTMTHRDDHDMHDITMSMPQINVDDNEFDDSQGVDMNVHMDSEAEDDRDNEGARYVDCSDLYNDVDDIDDGDGDLDDSFVVVRGASKKKNIELSPVMKTMFNVLNVRNLRETK